MVDDPSGWLCVADPNWLDYLATQSDLQKAVYYKGPYRPTTRLPIGAPFICCRKGESPRRIHLIGLFNGYEVLTKADAWSRYGHSLGVPTATKWNEMDVGKDGKISCHELVDFYFLRDPILLSSIGVTITNAASSMGRYLSKQEREQISESVDLSSAAEMLLPGEFPSSLKLQEGAYSKIRVNKYERNQRARRLCIQHFGPICAVCNLLFSDFYGEIGQDFIHVHHLVPLSSINDSYTVDPISDLRPVCPNCHAMLHKSNPPFTIDELKQMLKNKLQ